MKKSSSEFIHNFLKQQAAQDLKRSEKWYPTQEEVDAAPPPTPEAAARMAELFERFREENEQRKSMEEAVEDGEEAIAKLCRQYGKHPNWRNIRRIIISIAACLGIMLGGYTGACAFTSWKTGQDFVNVFCEGYVRIQRADASSEETSQDQKYTESLRAIVAAYPQYDVYLPTWMVSGYMPDKLELSDTYSEITFTKEKTDNCFLLIKNSGGTIYHDTEVDYSATHDKNGTEYTYSEKTTVDRLYRQVVAWHNADVALSITFFGTKGIISEQEMVRVAMSVEVLKNN